MAHRADVEQRGPMAYRKNYDPDSRPLFNYKTQQQLIFCHSRSDINEGRKPLIYLHLPESAKPDTIKSTIMENCVLELDSVCVLASLAPDTYRSAILPDDPVLP